MEKSAKIGGTYLRQAVLVYSHTCFSPAIYMLLHFQKRRADSHGFKYCQKTATAGDDMLLSKHPKSALAAATRLCEDGFLVNYLKKQRQEGKGQLT